MKLLLLASLFVISFSTPINQSDPNPTPLPYLNYERLLGTWYGIWSYPNQTQDVNASCWANSVGISPQGNITWNTSYTINSHQTNLTLNFTLANKQGSLWNNSGILMTWMAVDPLHYSWVLGAYGDEVIAMSRTKTLSNSIVQAQIQLAKKQGYDMEPDLILFYDNSNCNYAIQI